MTIIAAVKKNGLVCIAGDTQSNFGSLQVSSKYINNSTKLFKMNNNILGVTGWCATSQILEHFIEVKPELFKLDTRRDIFESFLGIHEKLKNDYFIETTEESEQPVESNQLDALIINKNGIFEVSSYREVHEHNLFWALGSGKRIALGAMHALYDTDATAQKIAEAGAKAASEFDDGCGLPIQSLVLELG